MKIRDYSFRKKFGIWSTWLADRDHNWYVLNTTCEARYNVIRLNHGRWPLSLSTLKFKVVNENFISIYGMYNLGWFKSTADLLSAITYTSLDFCESDKTDGFLDIDNLELCSENK